MELKNKIKKKFSFSELNIQNNSQVNNFCHDKYLVKK